MPLAALGPVLLGAAGTSAAATTAAWSAIGAGAAGLGSAAINAHAAGSAADTTSAAANHAADLKAQADAEALAFQKEQSENAFQNSEAARAGNYGMYAAGQQRLQSAGEALGIPGAASMQIPAYVPGVDPHLTGQTAGQALTGTGPAGTSKAAPLTPQIVQQAAQGLNPADPKSLSTVVSRLSAMGYDASVMQNNGAPSDHKVWVNGTPWTFVSSQGYQPGTFKWDPYTQGSTAGSFNAQGIPLGGAPGASPTAPSSVGQYLTPYAPVAQAPALPMPTAGSYLGAG